MKTKDSFDYLLKEGYIDFGVNIPSYIIEKALYIKSKNDISFIGPLLTLKQYIEDKGFFCTTKGCEFGELRILSLEKMSKKCELTQKNIINKQKRVVNSMTRADITNLKDKEKIKHEHSTYKACLGLKSLKSVLAGI